jgi:hypothetical protein
MYVYRKKCISGGCTKFTLLRTQPSDEIFEISVMMIRFHETDENDDQNSNYKLLKKDSVPWH